MATPMPAADAERVQRERGQTAPTFPGPADAPLLTIAAPAEFDLPLLVVRLEAATLDAPPDPKGGQDARPRKVAAYDVTFQAVVPESFAAAIVAAARDHRLTVRVTAPAPEGVER